MPSSSAQADQQGMGITPMRPLTSGVFQRVMAEAFPEIDVLDVGRLLLIYVLSGPYVDVAPVGMREPQFVELSNEISDDVTSRINLVMLRDQYVLRAVRSIKQDELSFVSFLA
jgi:predicted aldo/keto reductase-like oxidoreductase